jgi:serine/threonine-protein kinase
MGGGGGMHVDRWQVISGYLDRALELAPEERGAWLSELASREPAIAEEVSQLLDVRSEHGFDSFLGDSPVCAALDVVPGNMSGKRIGAYVLEREIGRGGMGSVWLASRGDGHYEGRVAVKLLGGAWLGEDATRRFRREATLLARLDHPHIARLIDAGITDFGQPYLVLEYVQGASIDEHCKTFGLGVPARLQLFSKVLEAVAYAHRRLIIHRDIKPANIFVADDGAVKLLDFGIAKLITHDELATPQTHAASVALTPEYASPEQLLGQSVTTATDIYTLGLTLFKLLTGRHPFPEARQSTADAVRTAVHVDAPLPSDVALSQDTARELRGDLDNILCKALRKAPEDRYATVDAFADDLRRVLTHEPVTAGPDTVRYRVSKFVRRHRGSVAAGALTALALIAATAITTVQMIEARHQRDEAGFQTRRAEAANEFLNVLLQSDGGSDKPMLNGRERLELGVQMIERQYRDDPQFAARMLILLGEQFRGNNETKRAIELYSKAYDLGRQTRNPELMARAQCTAAYAEAVAQNTELAPKRLAEAKRLLAGVRNPLVDAQVDCLQAEGLLMSRLGDFNRAESILKQAQKLLEQANETYRATYTSVLNDLGGTYAQTNRYQKAYEMARLNGATHERYGRGGTGARMIIWSNEAVALAAMGEIKAAWELREKIQERVAYLEPDGQASLPFAVNLALVLNRLGRPGEALNALTNSVQRARDSHNNFWLLASLRATGESYTQLGRFAEAEAALADAMKLAQTAKPNLNNRIPIEVAAIRLKMLRGDLDGAQRQAEALLAMADYPASQKFGAVRMVLTVASEIALKAGHPVEAERRARQALAVSESMARGENTSGDVGEALLALSKAKAAQSSIETAKPLLERAVRCLTNGFGSDYGLTREAQELLKS